LSYFLGRFPNLTILQADKEDEELGPVLVQVFKRKAFLTVESFENVLVEGVFYGHVPFSILAAALPNLHTLGLDPGEPFLEWDDKLQMHNFFFAFRMGMFPKVHKIQLNFLTTDDKSQQTCVLEWLARALEARERRGGFPCLTHFEYYATEIDRPYLENLLSLDPCTKIRHLQYMVRGLDDGLAMQEIVAAYMQRMQCRWLEYVTVGRLTEEDGHLLGHDDTFGPIGDVIRSGMATNLKNIEGNFIGKAGFEELSSMIDAGLLPNLNALEFSITPTVAINIGGWTNGALNPLLVELYFWHDPLGPLMFLHALHQGAFPKLAAVSLKHITEGNLKLFIDTLQSKGIKGAHTLRYVMVGKDISKKTLQQLRALLPAAKVRQTISQ
jgi:hypothetical protein